MKDVYYELERRAEGYVDEGETDKNDAFQMAYEDMLSSSDSDWKLWQLIKDCFTTDEIIDALDAREKLYDHARFETESNIENYIYYNTYSLYFCEKADKLTEYDCEEVVGKDKLKSMLDDYKTDGFIKFDEDKYDIWLYGPVEEED